LGADYVITPIKLPDDLPVTMRSIETLPPDWDAGEPTNDTRDIGTEWTKSLATVVLVVPSVVIPRECNYTVNPQHPDVPRMQFFSPEPFYFDDRLGRVRVRT